MIDFVVAHDTRFEIQTIILLINDWSYV